MIEKRRMGIRLNGCGLIEGYKLHHSEETQFVKSLEGFSTHHKRLEYH
jgi:hypothetical protein